MIQDYTQLLDRISKASGIEKEEIERKIEAKRAKLSGLISKEGAAQIIAAELGISFEKEKMKIAEIMQGMKRVNVTGKIIRLFPVKSYEKNGKSGKIGSMIIADDSGNVRVVLWDTNHIDLIEKAQIKEEDVVDIVNASIRNSEIHLTGFSEIKLSQEKLENVKTERTYREKKIEEIQAGDSASFRAFVVQVFEPRFFEVCPECGKKLLQDADGKRCETHGKVLARKRALVNFVLDDGSENLRSVLFSSQLEGIGLKEEELEASFATKRQELLGKEFNFTGSIRQNRLFGNNELIVDSAEEVEVEKLIELLERKA